MNILIKKSGFAVIALVLTNAVSAAALAPGGLIFPVGTDFTDPVHGGVSIVINDNLIDFRMDPTPITPLSDIGGHVQNRVTDSQNTGFLNFAPRIRDTFNIDGGTFGITSFSIDGFGSFATNVEFRTDGLGDKGFTSVSRSADGNQLTFRYDNPLLIDSIAPGLQEESLFPSIATDAMNYELSGRMTIYGQLFAIDFGTPPRPIGDLISVTISGVAVPSAIPVPAAMWLFGSALLGLGICRRR